MRQRGPRSAASLWVVAMTETPRPAPPRNMERTAKMVWRDVVQRFRPDHFVGCEYLLQLFCEAVVTSRWLGEQIKTEMASHDDKRLAAMVLMQRHQTQAIGNLGRHLRITPRSRYDRYSAAARPTSGLPKPWELGGTDK